MFNVYQELKNLTPVAVYIKKRINGDFLIIATELGEIRYLNEVAKEFYLAIDGKKTVEEIVNKLLTEYSVDRTVLENDIVDLIRELQWQRLVVLKEYSLKG